MAVQLAIAATIGIVVVTLALAVLAARLGELGVATAIAPALAAALVTIAAVALHLTTVAPLFAAPVTALGWLFGVLATLPRSDARPMTRGIVAAILTAAVYLPVTSVVFSLDYDPFGTGIGFIDLGWALPALVGGSAAAIGSALVGRRQQASDRTRWWATLWPALVAWLATVAWLVGIALIIDRNTPTILANAVIMPLVAAGFWAVVERARHRTNTPAGVALGLIAGCAAAVPAAGNVIPLLGGLIAAVAGGVSALLPARRRMGGSVRIVVTVLASSGISILLLGLLGRDVSFIYTGQPEVLFTQVQSLVVTVVGGLAAGLVVWWVVDRISASRRP